jgi:Tc5 transposase DNA-binding domain
MSKVSSSQFNRIYLERNEKIFVHFPAWSPPHPTLVLMPAAGDHKCKPWGKPKPYVCKPCEKKDPNAPRTLAKKPQTSTCENLTLNNWLTVVDYHDYHQPISQQEVVSYFANQAEGALIFNQLSLSRHLSKKGRAVDEEKIQANPTALSAKRVRVVTRPDVEKCLVLWGKHMEEAKGEMVTSPMLIAKREKFEKQLNVAEEEQLKGDGWLFRFCKTYILSLI